MRKEYIVFFSLILAAAITAGSTLSLADNAQALVKYSTAQQKENQKPVDNEKNQSASEEKRSEKTYADPSSALKLNPQDAQKTSYIYIADENKPVSLTEEQKAQVMAMLKELGMKSEEEYSHFLLKFQEEHNLPPTGQLDSLTLELIVNQVQIERAMAQIRAAHRR